MQLIFGVLAILVAAFLLLRPELGHHLFRRTKNSQDVPSYSYRVTAGIAGIALLLLGFLLIINSFV